MENNITKLSESLSEFIKNCRLNISLEGWPAAVSTIALCGSTVALYAIKVARSA